MSSVSSSSSALLHSVFIPCTQYIYTFTGYNYTLGHEHCATYSTFDFHAANLIRHIRSTVGVNKTFHISFNTIPFGLARNRTESACNVAELRAISRRLVQYRFVPFRFVPRRLCSSAAMSRPIEAVTIAAASKENAFGNVGCFSVAPGKVASGRSASCTARQSTPIYGKQVSVYSTTRQYTNRTPTQPLT